MPAARRRRALLSTSVALLAHTAMRVRPAACSLACMGFQLHSAVCFGCAWLQHVYKLNMQIPQARPTMRPPRLPSWASPRRLQRSGARSTCAPTQSRLVSLTRASRAQRWVLCVGGRAGEGLWLLSWGPLNVRANAIAFGLINTRLTRPKVCGCCPLTSFAAACSCTFRY